MVVFNAYRVYVNIWWELVWDSMLKNHSNKCYAYRSLHPFLLESESRFFKKGYCFFHSSMLACVFFFRCSYFTFQIKNATCCLRVHSMVLNRKRETNHDNKRTWRKNYLKHSTTFGLFFGFKCILRITAMATSHRNKTHAYGPGSRCG